MGVIDGREDYRPWFVKEFSPGDRRQVVKPTYKAQSCSFFPVSNSAGDEYSEESINTAIKYLKSGIEEQPLDCDPTRLWTCIRCDETIDNTINGLDKIEMENKKQIIFDHPSSGAKHYQFLTLPMVEFGKVLITRGGTDMLQSESILISAARPCTVETRARDCGEIITVTQAQPEPAEIGLLSREYCVSLLDEFQFNWATKKNDIDQFWDAISDVSSSNRKDKIMEVGLEQFRPDVENFKAAITGYVSDSGETLEAWWNIGVSPVNGLSNKMIVLEHWCATYRNNSATRTFNLDGTNIPVSIAKYSQSVLYATIPPGESPDTMQISFDTAGQLSKCLDKDTMYKDTMVNWHSGRSAKDCSVNYLAPNLVSIQAEIDILSGKPNANTEGGFKLTLLGYNFGRPEPYSDLPYDEPLNGLPITPTTLSNLLVIGKSYTIVTSNSLDWTAVGAVDSQVGTVFTANSSNLGTGGTATALGGENDPLVVKIKGIVCPIISHGHNKIVCQMSEGEGRDLAVDVSLYHNDTDSSNPKIDDIKATWQNGNRNIEKSDFYSKVSRIQYHFDPPVVNKLWIEHEDYTISIQNGDVDYDGKSHKNKKFGLNYKNEVIHLLNSTGKRGPGLPTSGKSLKGNKDLWIHIEGKNFGSSASSRQIDVKSHVLHPEGVWDGWQLLAGEIERVDSVNAQGENQHRHLKFKLLPGEGQNLKFSLQIQDQPISNLDYGKYDIYAQNSDYFENDVFVGPNLINISYAQPRLDLLTAEGHGSAGDIGDYIFPTSGCGKFIVANLDEDGKLKCDFKTTFVLEGENFGKTIPLVLVHDAENKIVEVTVFENCDSYCRNKIEYDIKDQPKLDEKGITIKCSNGCDSEKEPKFRTDTKLMLEVPPGVGSSMVEVRTRDVNVITDSNLLKQSPPGLDAASDETNEAIPAPLRRRLSRRDLSRRRLQRLDSRKSVYGRASNSKTFDYSSPEILDTRFGIDIDSASLSGVIAAIGGDRMGEEQGIPWRFYILGENFGETEPLVDLRMTPIYSDNQLTGWMPNKIGGNKNGQTIYCRSRPSNVLSSAATDWGQFKYCPDKNAKCYEGGSDSEYGICKIQDLNYLNITLVHEYYARGMESITPCISRKEATASNGQSLTDVLDKSTACRYYQDIMSCYPPGYCVDVANKDIIASQITSSVDALKILGVNDCTLKCGAGHEPFLTKTVEEPCLNATWHSHTKHPWRYSGRPMLSCLVPPTTVGRKRIKVDVATIEVTMDITLDARCFEGFYGKIGEYCAQCWNYIQRHPNIPDAIETVYAAECYANYDSDVGTSEPVSHRGFAILPPQDCQNGGCKISAKCCLDGNCRYKEMTPAMVDSYDVESCETGISDEVVIDGEIQGYK